MCAQVVVEDINPVAPKWDRPRVVIVIGRGLTKRQAMRQVRALLIALGASQEDSGATCWCGDAVHIPRAERVPQQRSHHEGVRSGT